MYILSLNMIIFLILLSRNFHIRQKKPLFKNVTDANDNDEFVKSYMMKKLQSVNVEKHGIVYVYMIINRLGKVVEASITYSSNPKINDVILSIIKEMPLWTPAENKGRKVNVHYLIDLKI